MSRRSGKRRTVLWVLMTGSPFSWPEWRVWRWTGLWRAVLWISILENGLQRNLQYSGFQHGCFQKLIHPCLLSDIRKNFGRRNSEFRQVRLWSQGVQTMSRQRWLRVLQREAIFWLNLEEPEIFSIVLTR